MKKVRLIARLDIKGPNLIKGVHLEGLRVVGSPNEYAVRYYEQGADELIYMDSVASLYARNHLGEIIKAAAKDIFIPMTVGGGIRSIDDATEILRSGADKVAINTAAVADPTLISKLAQKFGSQCVVLSIEAKKNTNSEWEVLTENGRERSGLNVVSWAIQGFEYGAGEILLTSVDMEGTRKGFDCDLVRAVRLRNGFRADEPEVRAALRLREVHGTGPFPGHHFGQVGFLLLVRSAFLDRFGRAARQARIHREGHVGR